MIIKVLTLVCEWEYIYGTIFNVINLLRFLIIYLYQLLDFGCKCTDRDS